MTKTTETEGMSYDTKTIIVILLLVFVYPLGLVFMLMWMKWPTWVKVLIALPVGLIVLAFLGIIAVGMLAAVNPKAQIEKANQIRMEREKVEDGEIIVTPTVGVKRIKG